MIVFNGLSFTEQHFYIGLGLSLILSLNIRLVRKLNCVRDLEVLVAWHMNDIANIHEILLLKTVYVDSAQLLRLHG